MRDGGRLITLSTSVVGIRLENYSVYAASKAAVETMGAILSSELRGRNITVNAVAPGPTATDLFLNGKSPELIERLAKMNPWSGWVRRTTSPARWGSWRVPMADGSTARCCAPTAGWCRSRERHPRLAWIYLGTRGG